MFVHETAAFTRALLSWHFIVSAQGSSDSGKGGSDIHGGSEAAGGAGNLSPEEELSRTYEFELPRELCGRFIGQGGRNVTAIKSRSNTRIYVQQHPFSSKLKICSIQGVCKLAGVEEQCVICTHIVPYA